MNRTDKVLHADDDQKYLNTLRDSLHKFKGQLKVMTPTNAGEAIKVLKRERISGFFPDSTLPRPGGPQLLAYINRNHPQIPCTIMAKHGIPNTQKKRGRKDILRNTKKPFIPNELNTATLEGVDFLYEDVFCQRYW
jgi:DNA-binding NtrC family response regulator